ncbi:MAG: ATP-binding protein [bacterium]|jgi:predicted AAA+ superfamily ATPase
MGVSKLVPRLAADPLEEAMADSPVVLIHGARQCGKSTLARQYGEARGYHSLTFDDSSVLELAQADPNGFVADLPDRVILDEVQRVPEIFLALKLTVDRNRAPGRFLLTGSSNILLLPSLADSLAGRMAIVRLHPFAQCELVKSRPIFLEKLLSAHFPISKSDRQGRSLADRIVQGGFPTMISLPTPARRARWHRDYVETIVQRDIRSLARIASVDAVPRLLELLSGQTARALNISELAGPFGLSRPTIREYVNLLARMFLVDELPAWHSNRISRLIKSPKVHVTDTGLACALLGVTAEALWEDRDLFGQMLETFVYGELRRQASASPERVGFGHFRHRDGAEVDIVLEHGAGRVSGVEVKASSTVRPTDFAGLKALREACGKRFACGVVAYDGETSIGFGDGMFAVPIARLWS